MEAKDLVIAVMAEVRGIAKKDKNTAQGFNFRGIDAVVNAVGPAIRNHGGWISSKFIFYKETVLTAKSGNPVNSVSAIVKYKIHGTEGKPVSSEVYAAAFDSGDKAGAKMMSVALRTFFIQTLVLPTDEPDPDLAIYELGEQSDGAPTVTELKAKIAGYFFGQPKTAITAALEDHTGKKANWSLDELAGYLYTLEGSK
jgi:hypothetical protein